MAVTTLYIEIVLRAARIIRRFYCLPAGGAGAVHTRLDGGSKVPQCEYIQHSIELFNTMQSFFLEVDLKGLQKATFWGNSLKMVNLN